MHNDVSFYDMEESALIYIPDISGFTSFMTDSDVGPATKERVISELLDYMLELNEIDLRASEIEGDAVLFFRQGSPPSINEVVSQTKKMFIGFHERLKEICEREYNNIGKHIDVSKLTVKFIVHFGHLQEINVA